MRDPVTLSDGDLLELGRTFWRFRAALPTPPHARPDLDSDEPSNAPPGWATLLPALAEKNAALAKVALSTVPVMLHGETGTGKEVLARAIHHASGRRGRFIAVNCGAIPPTLVEAQLFGHVRGAFSGATQNEPGFVRSADGGTLFLDEIGDLPRGAQAALLRVLQEREVVPVGSADAQRVDMRVICATHNDLREGVTRGLFRADLLARLDGLTHTLLPLRDRMEDMGLLIAALLSRISRVGREHPAKLAFTLRAARALLAHDWPLNVRELEQRLSVAAVLATTGTIDVEHLPAGASGVPLKALEETPDEADEALRKELVRELDRTGGNVAAVARSMGKARMQVQRWMKRLKIDAGAFRAQ